MTSSAKVVANRRNALRSTGPRTVEGKSRSSRNAFRHGLLSNIPVLPDLERQEDWLVHLDGVLDSLRPSGYLEVALAERVASTPPLVDFLQDLGRLVGCQDEVARRRVPRH